MESLSYCLAPVAPRNLKLWDTETGECISAFTNRKLPYCVKVAPTLQPTRIPASVSVLDSCAAVTTDTAGTFG